MKYLLAGLCAALLCAGAATAGQYILATHHHDVEELHHGGGLDQCGGHYNRKTGQYHYHRPPKC